MKILLVVWNLYPEQAYTNRTLATCEGFNENGVHADIVTIKPSPLKYKHLLNKWSGSEKNSVKDYFGTLYGIILMICKIPMYDVIFCATRNNLILKTAYFISRLFGKIIINEHTEHPEVCTTRNSAGEVKKAKGINLLGRYDKIFVISSNLKDYFINKKIKAEKIDFFPMIVNPERFNNLTKSRQNNPYIAYCGNMVDFKDGVTDLIKAFGKTKTAKGKYILKLIGKKPEGKDMDKYRKLCQDLDIENQVIFTGTIPSDTIPQELKNADILALCRPASKQAEGGFPTKLGEYLATANPVVVTDTGDIGKYIIDEETGYIVEANDIEGFAEKLDLISQNYESAETVGRRGRELVDKEFNYKEQTSRLINILKRDFNKL